MKLQQSFHDYLDGKRVVLVGPAAYLDGSKLGAFIDSFDVVCRIGMQHPMPEAEKVNRGSRTDILFTNFNEWNEKHEPYSGRVNFDAQIDGDLAMKTKMIRYSWRVDFPLNTYLRHPRTGDIPVSVMETGVILQLLQIFHTCSRRRVMLTNGLLSILDLVTTRLKSLDILGITFMQKCTVSEYIIDNPVMAQVEKKIPKDWKAYLPQYDDHDIPAEMEFFKAALQQDNRIIIDDFLKDILFPVEA